MDGPEGLVLMSSTIVVPAMIVLIVAFFRGRLQPDEDARRLPIREQVEDFWDTSERDGDEPAPVSRVRPEGEERP